MPWIDLEFRTSVHVLYIEVLKLLEAGAENIHTSHCKQNVCKCIAVTRYIHCTGFVL